MAEHSPEIALTRPGGFCIFKLRFGGSESEERIRERAMQYFVYFAFTYRFSFAEERTGETRAGNRGN
jgi:hypothetical protein